MVNDMRKNQLFVMSNDGVTNIHKVIWEPDNEVFGIVQVIHGIAEHIDRYEELARYLTDRGMLVVGIDLVGHGLSTNNGNKKMYFGGEGSYNYVLEDINECYKNIKEMYPNVPYTMLGFSLGSLLLRTYLINYPNNLDGSIIVGTNMLGSYQISSGYSVVKKEARKYGEINATEKIRDLTYGLYNKKFKPNKTEFDWLSSNPQIIDLFINDPLCGDYITIGLYREMLSLMKYSGDKNYIKKMNKIKPILVLAGSDDNFGDCGKDSSKLADVFKKSGISDVSLKIYPSLRHDILHDIDSNIIYQDIYNWLNTKKLFKENIIINSNQVSNNENKSIVNNNQVNSILSDRL